MVRLHHEIVGEALINQPETDEGDLALLGAPIPAASLGLVLLRYATGVTVGGLAVAVPLTFALDGIVAPAGPPFAIIAGWLIGLPLALFMRSRGWRGARHAVLAGLAIGLFPVGILSIFAKDWSSLFEALGMGLLPVGAAWLALKVQSVPLRRVPALYAIPAAICLAVMTLASGIGGALFAARQIAGPPDTSCHNIFRHGGRSFPAMQTAKLRLERSDWPRFREVVQAFAADEGWSFKDYPHPDALGGSLCLETGTQVSYQQFAYAGAPAEVADQITVNVFAPQGGEEWRQPAGRLFARLSAAWPGAVVVKEQGEDGQTTNTIAR